MEELRLECLRLAHQPELPAATVVERAKAYHDFLFGKVELAPTNPDKPFSGCTAVSGDRSGHVVSADDLIGDYVARTRSLHPHWFNAAGDLLPERARPAAVGRVRRIRRAASRYIRRSLLAVFRCEDPTLKEPVRSRSERRPGSDRD